jgi:hypothetical protein
MMEESDYWWLWGTVLVITIHLALHSKMLHTLFDHQVQLREDVNWLKDNTVATTETRA